MNAIHCPKCGSTDIRPGEAGMSRCAFCGTMFTQAAAQTFASQPYPPQPYGQAYAAPAARGGNKVGLLVALAALLLVFAGAGVFVLTAGGSPAPMRAGPTNLPRAAKEAAPITPAKPGPVSVDSESLPKPRAEVRDILTAEQHGIQFWVFNFVNTGSCPIVSPTVAVSLFDAEGKRVGEQMAYLDTDWLEPGETCAHRMGYLKAPAFARYELVPRNLEAPSYQSRPLRCEVIEPRIENPRFGGIRAIGTVRNPHPQDLTYVKVRIVALNAEDKPVDCAFTFVTGTHLKAGQSDGFSAHFTGKPLAEVKRYEFIAEGRP